MRRRSTLEIRIEILENARENIKPTHLMYACRLSWDPLRERIEELKANGLIDEIELDEDTIRRDKRSKIKYRTTAKGADILKTLKEVTKSIG